MTALQDEVTAFFYGNPDYSDLPRKHKISISACAHRCNAPEINCISLVGVIRDGEPGFAVLVGGGLSSVPRIARDLGVFVRVDEALPVLRALLDAWKEDLRYRVSRVKARLKFMVDDYGPEGMRAEVERRLGYALPDFELEPLDREPADHMGAEPEHDPSLATLGAPVHLGLISGDQMIAVAGLAEEHGRDVRVTRQQNLVVTGIAAVETVSAALGEIGFPVDANRLRSNAIGCTGEPHCNFAVAETKTRLARAHRAPRGAVRPRRSRSSGSTSTAARTPAASTGSATSASRARPSATPRASAARPTTCCCAGRSARARRSAVRSSGACRPRSWTGRSSASSPPGSRAEPTARASGRTATARPTTSSAP